MKIPTTFNFPWQPKEFSISGKNGYVINKAQVEYFKRLLKSIISMYTTLSNAINLEGYRNNGTAEITSGNTTVDVTHGIEKTPGLKDIRINPTNISTNSVTWAVTSVTSTVFTITSSGDPGVSGLSFSWEVHILG